MENKENCSALIVDDNAVLRNIAEQLLKSCGFETVAVENGREAVDYFVDGNSCDIVLMDMEMPIMNGIEATKMLRAMGVKTLIFGVTSSKSLPDIQAFIEAGIDEYVEKPLSIGKLKNMLKRLP